MPYYDHSRHQLPHHWEPFHWRMLMQWAELFLVNYWICSNDHHVSEILCGKSICTAFGLLCQPRLIIPDDLLSSANQRHHSQPSANVVLHSGYWLVPLGVYSLGTKTANGISTTLTCPTQVGRYCHVVGINILEMVCQNMRAFSCQRHWVAGGGCGLLWLMNFA